MRTLTFFTYTTLFRSARADELDGFGGFLGRRRKLVKHGKVEQLELHIRRNALRNVFQQRRQEKVEALGGPLVNRRSEEHTSELQSRGHLVCRLLLEKK